MMTIARKRRLALGQLAPPERSLADRLIRQGIPPADAETIARHALAVNWTEVFSTSAELAEAVGKTRATIEYRATRFSAPPEERPHILKRGGTGGHNRYLWLRDFAVPAFTRRHAE